MGDAVDLLFVIDNSYGTLGIHDVFEPQVFYLLEELIGYHENRQEIADLHVGVITADVGAGGYDIPGCNGSFAGALQGRSKTTSSGCPEEEIDPPFLEHSILEPNDGGPSDPNGMSLLEELQCIISSLGMDGCQVEQPLQSLRLALTDRVEDGTNAGFFRQGAVLVVVFVTEEDDCTALDPSFYSPHREDLAVLAARCYVHPELLEPVENFADLLRAQRPTGRVFVGGWITVPLEWDGSLEELLRYQNVDWRTARVDDFYYCHCSDGQALVAPRLAGLILDMGTAGVAWSQCSFWIAEELESFGQLVLDHLDPVACLPSNPPESSRCEVTLNLLEVSGECPEGTREIEPGMCELREEQWSLLETDRCTELRASDEVAVPPGAWLALRCFAR
jgi:hypothetical protein